MRTLNSFVHRGVLRRYQADVLDRGEITAISPFNGGQVTSRYSAAGVRGQNAYYFSGADAFWLLVQRGSFQFGHPLSEMIGPTGEWLHLWRRKTVSRSLGDDEFGRLIAASRRAVDKIPDGGRSTALVLGHENFAHLFWNELPALHMWLETVSDETLEKTTLALTGEPLGPLCEMYPRLALARHGELAHAPRSLPLHVRLGGQRVPTEVRDHVRRFVDARGDTPRVAALLKIIARGFPRVWISVRHGSRTPDNQTEFLLAVVRRVLLVFPLAAIVFDGFSFPAGFFGDSRTKNFRSQFQERASVDRSFMEFLIGEIGREHGSEIASRLCTTSGLSLPEAINVAGSCSFYLCHAGTLQHKIAWFHDVPGVVHTAPNDHKYALWCASFIEGAIEPKLLPETFSIPTTPPINKSNIARNYNYLIANVDQAAEAVVSMFQEVQSAPNP